MYTSYIFYYVLSDIALTLLIHFVIILKFLTRADSSIVMMFYNTSYYGLQVKLAHILFYSHTSTKISLALIQSYDQIV
jgi:hypothetical protein